MAWGLRRLNLLNMFTGLQPLTAPEYTEALAVVVVVAAVIGELPPTLWLLFKRVNVERVAAASAGGTQ